MESVVSISASGTVSNYVDGEWRQSAGDAVESVEDSATGEVLAEVPGSTTAEVDAAVEAARATFEDWHERPVEERIQPLFRFKQQLESRQESLAETLVREHGKTFDEAMGELRRGIENLEVATGVPSLTQSGHLPNAAPEIDETAVRKPLGVFGAITPFNFPGMIPLWFLPYAVAAGNTFVLKPSEKTPLTATRLLSLLAETDLPDGVVNLVNGGPDTVDALLEHPTVEGVSFVGSTAVAEHVYETAAAHGKRVQAQGGAKNHVVVAPSASLSFAAEGTVGSAFANSGQRCLANPIAIVVDDVYDEFESLVVEAAADLEVGPGMEQGVEMGPLIDTDRRNAVETHIETAVEEGAIALLDGRSVEFEGDAAAYFLGPTVLGGVTAGMSIAREEVFGPVLSLVRVPSLSAAFEFVNESRYGNAASLYTERGADARRFRHVVEAGNLGVNVGTAAPMAFFHFGGWKDSFFGDLHAQAEDVLRFYTDEAIYIERWPDAE